MLSKQREVLTECNKNTFNKDTCQKEDIEMKHRLRTSCGGLTRLWQRVFGTVIALKEFKDGSSLVEGVLSLPSINSRLSGKDADLNKKHILS